MGLNSQLLRKPQSLSRSCSQAVIEPFGRVLGGPCATGKCWNDGDLSWPALHYGLGGYANTFQPLGAPLGKFCVCGGLATLPLALAVGVRSSLANSARSVTEGTGHVRFRRRRKALPEEEHATRYSAWTSALRHPSAAFCVYFRLPHSLLSVCLCFCLFAYLHARLYRCRSVIVQLHMYMSTYAHMLVRVQKMIGKTALGI